MFSVSEGKQALRPSFSKVLLSRSRKSGLLKLMSKGGETAGWGGIREHVSETWLMGKSSKAFVNGNPTLGAPRSFWRSQLGQGIKWPRDPADVICSSLRKKIPLAGNGSLLTAWIHVLVLIHPWSLHSSALSWAGRMHHPNRVLSGICSPGAARKAEVSAQGSFWKQHQAIEMWFPRPQQPVPQGLLFTSL